MAEDDETESPASEDLEHEPEEVAADTVEGAAALVGDVPVAVESAVEGAERAVESAADTVATAADDASGPVRDALQTLSGQLRSMESVLAGLPAEIQRLIGESAHTAEKLAEVPVQAADAAAMEVVAPVSPAPVKANTRPRARRPLRGRR